MQDDQLMLRLDRLESRVAIAALASDYCHGFDKRDEACFMNIWWQDCVWDIGPPFGRFDGHEGVRATLAGPRRPASNRSLIGAAIARPAGGARVMALIYWQALRLWLKKAPFLRKPPPPQDLISNGKEWQKKLQRLEFPA